MKLRQLTVIFTLLLTYTYSLAGNEYGNGGDVVYCPQEDGPPKVEMLDLYEARTRLELEPDLGPKELTPIEKAHYVLDRLQRVDPFRVENYRITVDTFHHNALFMSGVTLVDVPDSHHIALPINCEIRQIAIQKEPSFPEERLYTISKDLWDLLDDNNKAGLILHETVYGEAIKFAHQNSINTRYFTGLIASTVINNISREEYAKRVNSAELLAYSVEIDGVRYLWEDLSFFSNGKLQSGIIYKFPLDCHSPSNCMELEVLEKEIRGTIFKFFDSISFFEDGSVKKGILLGDPLEPITYEISTDFNCNHKLISHGGSWGPFFVAFVNNGDIQSAIGNSILSIPLPGTERCIEIEAMSTLFYPNGLPTEIYLAGKQKLPVHENRLIYFSNDTQSDLPSAHYTKLHDNGIVSSGNIANYERLLTTNYTYRSFPAKSHLMFDREGKVIVD
ncbi:MAG: hypothetical protein A3F16_01730 [Deltaproteobacteria bacterium RIFCSPHIGHO2_12_FULL_43_9]|nr:MAG: hypothetical protein A3F16_01730 [Deltaproteobacteria bacterium RIFCSPHIGHO2_12_FULL_43_9]